MKVVRSVVTDTQQKLNPRPCQSGLPPAEASPTTAWHRGGGSGPTSERSPDLTPSSIFNRADLIMFLPGFLTFHLPDLSWLQPPRSYIESSVDRCACAQGGPKRTLRR